MKSTKVTASQDAQRKGRVEPAEAHKIVQEKLETTEKQSNPETQVEDEFKLAEEMAPTKDPDNGKKPAR